MRPTSRLLLERAARTAGRRSADRRRRRGFIAPDDMPARIQAACRTSGQTVPDDPAEIVRCVLDSLAIAYAHTVQQAEELTGRRVETVHVVGGGSQNALLCQLTADRTGRPVLAGPTEATALGNVVVQARTAGALTAPWRICGRCCALGWSCAGSHRRPRSAMPPTPPSRATADRSGRARGPGAGLADDQLRLEDHLARLLGSGPICSISSSTAVLPINSDGCRTEVSGTTVAAAKSMSS